jgi:hypothetical protein
MGTVIRAEVSKRSKWWLPKHRYYELKHYCLQYRDMKEELESLIKLPGSFCDISGKGSYYSDRTGNTAVLRAYLTRRVEGIEQAALETDAELYGYILKAVTEGYTYEYLHGVMGIPCSRDYYYERYRKFFWVLSRKNTSL